MKETTPCPRAALILLAALGIIGTMSGSERARAAGAVDLRGYGTVQAAITPQRSEFACQSEAKADILLGKLLADLFWDAPLSHAGFAADHVAQTVRIGSRDVVVHQWPPYGAAIAARNQNRVLVIGGKDQQDAMVRASKEPPLVSAGALYAPLKP